MTPHAPTGRWLRRAACATGVWLTLGALPPARANDPELTQRSEEYLARRDELLRPVLRTYADQLRLLRLTMASRRDARLPTVETELQRVSDLLALKPLPLDLTLAAAVAGPDFEPADRSAGASQFSLLPARALLTGGAMYDVMDIPSIHFSSLSQRAEWRLPTLKPGRWQVRLSVGCRPGAEATARLTFAGQPPVVVRLEATGRDGEGLTLNLGEIDLSTPPATVRVELIENPTPIRGRAIGRFSLAEIILTPVGEG